MPYGEQGFRWNEGEIPGLPQTPGGPRPPDRTPGLSDADFLNQLIMFYTTPRNHQVRSSWEGGQSYGPSREATVRPGDMDTANELMNLVAALDAERFEEERRELEMKILGKPTGGGKMAMGPMEDRPTSMGPPPRGRGTRFAGAQRRPKAPPMGEMVPSHPRGGPRGSVETRPTSIGNEEEKISRREAGAVTGLISDAEYEVQRELAGQKADYYGARAGAARRISSSADYEYAQQRLEEIETRLLSKSVTDMERDELLKEQAAIKAALLEAVLGDNGRRPGGGGSGGGGAGGGVIKPSSDVTDWTPR